MAATGMFFAVAAIYFWYLDRYLRRDTTLEELRSDPRRVGLLVLRPLAIIVTALAGVMLAIALIQ